MKNGLVIFLLAAMGASAFAETIKDVRIVNRRGERYDVSSVRAFTSFRPGEEVADRETVLASIARDVQRMRESGRFSFVDARMDVEPDGVVLVYAVAPKHRLRRIEILGAKKMRNRKIRKKCGLKLGEMADDSTFEQARIRIKEAYRDFWRPGTKVTWKSYVDESLGTVDVLFRIEEGPKLVIDELLFEGNEAIPDKKLRKALKQKKKWLLSFITGAGKYKPELIGGDLFALKSLYMDLGYLDVQVSRPELDDAEPKKAKLVYRVEEGRQYFVSKVTVTGMKSFRAEELLRAVTLHEGDVASYKWAMDGVENLKAFYGNRGYVRTGVRPAFDVDAEAGTVAIRYEIGEGEIGTIERIVIHGNERTKDKVIRRELVVYPGDKYNRSRVKTSENRLRNLNYFEFVSSSMEPTAKSGRYDLDVRVKEKQTGQFSAGVGFSSVDDLVGYIELSQGNFDFKSWPPVGAGQKFKIRAQLGTSRNDLDISFVEPWFLNRRLSFGVDLFHHESRYFSDDYEQQNDGFRFSLGKPFTRFTRGRVAYTLERIEVYDVEDDASVAIKDEEGHRMKSGLDFTWTIDTRDRFFNPTRGNKTMITPYLAGGILGMDTDLYGLRVRSSQYFPLIGDMVLSLRGQLESVEAYAGSKDDAKTFGRGVPLFDRLFLGGAYSLRGYEYRAVSPIDPATGDPVGGNSSGFASIELTYPIWKQIRGAVFYDLGFVNDDSWDFGVSHFADDVGLGIRLDLPGFPLRLDYAWPINYDEDYVERDSDTGGRFNFLIGNSF